MKPSTNASSLFEVVNCVVRDHFTNAIDRSGTTRIGKFVINHSFIIPGLLGVGTGCVVGWVIVKLMF